MHMPPRNAAPRTTKNRACPQIPALRSAAEVTHPNHPTRGMSPTGRGGGELLALGCLGTAAW